MSMKQVAVPGLLRFSSGRGPYQGEVMVSGVPTAVSKVSVGVGEDSGSEAGGGCVILIEHPQGIRWHWVNSNPTSAETVARMLCSMGHVTLDQLSGIGFERNRWLKVMGKEDDGSDGHEEDEAEI